MISIKHHSLNTASLKMAPAVGMVGRKYIQREVGEGASDCLRPAHGSRAGHVLSLCSSNAHCLNYLITMSSLYLHILFFFSLDSLFHIRFRD